MKQKTFCVLIPSHPHIRNAKHNQRLNISKYFGLRIVLNELEKNLGIVPDYVTFEHVHKYDVVLVSLHSVDDFYRVAFTFYHRLKGVKKSLWIGGGSAVQNLAPLSEIFDQVLIGRAEPMLVPWFNAILNDERFEHPSIVHFDTYSESNNYEISYVKTLYPDQLGKEKEVMSGCKYNCGYCRYRISALPPAMRDQDKNTTMPGNEETFWELEIDSAKPYTTSLDGFQQDIRYAVTKRISDEIIIEKLVAFAAKQPRINLKIYLICGYPHNSGFDFSALRHILAEVDSRIKSCKMAIKFHITPFSAEPGTPMQWEPFNIAINYNLAMRQFKREIGSVFESDNIRAYILNSTMSNWSVLQRAIHHRVDLAGLGAIRDISTNPFYRSHSRTYTEKFNKFIQDHDVTPFVREYAIGERLPNSNITSWRNTRSIEHQGNKIRNELKKASDYITPGPLALDLPICPIVAAEYPHLLPTDLVFSK